jgi:hypothetical protein
LIIVDRPRPDVLDGPLFDGGSGIASAPESDHRLPVVRPTASGATALELPPVLLPAKLRPAAQLVEALATANRMRGCQAYLITS